ncbi:hypothetical protein [Terrarubrum flagellatum]|uniref:hypothetical protein n=1 Tax=Terrirubrum flagellatum TaxID=2895980 RepID=UPI003144E0C7
MSEAPTPVPVSEPVAETPAAAPTSAAQAAEAIAAMLEASPAAAPDMTMLALDRITTVPPSEPLPIPTVAPPPAPAIVTEPAPAAASEIAPAARVAPPEPPAPPKPSALSLFLAAAGARAQTIGSSIMASVWGRRAVYGGGVVGALALGWAGASAVAPAPRPDPMAALAVQVDARLARLGDEVRGLRDQMALTAKNGRPRSADDLKPVQERIAALTEAFEKLRGDHAGRANNLIGAVDRVEKLDRDAMTKIAQIAERLDRIERQTMTTGSITPPQTPASQAAAPQPAPQQAAIPTPPARPQQQASAAPEKSNVTAIEQKTSRSIAGWALREIYDGVALIENRQYGMMEVGPGQTVRGLGRIEKIERRNGRWALVTEQGVILAN